MLANRLGVPRLAFAARRAGPLPPRTLELGPAVSTSYSCGRPLSTSIRHASPTSTRPVSHDFFTPVGLRRNASNSRSSAAIPSTSCNPRQPVSPSPLPLPLPLPLLAAAPLVPFHPIDSLSSLLLSSPLGCGSTIILLTLLFRTGATLPATLWQRARVHRTRELVVPEMRRINGELAGKVARECRAKGMGYEEYKKELKRQHRTHPLPTLLAPLAIHIPLLVTLSLSIRRAVETPGSDWASEAFWWIDKMGEVDTTGILPVVGGVVAMINAELVGRRSKEVGEVLRQEDEEAEAEGRVAGPGRVIGVSSVGAGNNVTDGVTGSVSSGLSRPNSGSTRQSSHTPNSRSGRSPPSPGLPGPAGPPASRSISTSPTPLALPRPRKSPPKRSTPPGAVAAAVPRPPAAASASVQPPSNPPSSSSSLSDRSNPSGHLVSHAPDKKSFSAQAKAAIRNQFLSRAMLVGGVLFIPIAAQVPAALALYWTTSMAYTVVQHLVLNWVDAREKAAKDDGSAAGQAA
ncbi:hypothetical protein JCM24511_00929 [Saitozyma sp. JCM 24511]|nr:hypothetical protein JCM24511_00929 [Saitozyma sp. JCM 24511]